MVAHALHHREGAAVADREPLARDPAEIGFAAGGPVERDVADQDVLLGHEGGLARGEDDELAAREALADVVVGVALEGERHPAGQEGPEALPGRAGEVDADGVVAQPLRAVARGDLRAQDRPHRPVDVLNGEPDVDRLLPLEGGRAHR